MSFSHKRESRDGVQQTKNMKRFGLILFTLGAASSIIQFFGREFVVLIWIDLWGTTVGWIIRIALMVGGLAIAAYAALQEPDMEEDI